MRKNTLFTLALLAIGLFWASCKGTDPEPSKLRQTENDILAKGGAWQVDSSIFVLTANVGGKDSLFFQERRPKGTITFEPISTDTVVKPGYGGLRRGLAVNTYYEMSGTDIVTVYDSLNWQVSPASLTDDTPRLVLFYNPGPQEVQFSFILQEHSSTRVIMSSERQLITTDGFPGHGSRKYVLGRL